MTGATFNDRDIVVVTPELVSDIKGRARTAKLRRYRYCFHQSPSDPVNEMVIAFCGDSYVRPHRHMREKSESYHIIEGRLAVFIFNDSGTVSRRIDLAASELGGPSLYHLRDGNWHMPVPITDPVVLHETFGGSFDPERDVEYASWAPAPEDIAAVTAFRHRLLSEHQG